MERNARRFVFRILVFHLLLLAMVVGTVYLASREIYQSARNQAIDQARRRQELLAAQTARGVESFYASILSALDLLQRAERDAPGGAVQLAPALWEQLEGPVSQLLLVDRDTLQISSSFSQDEMAGDSGIVRRAEEWLSQVKEPAVSPFQSGDERGQGATIICAPIESTGSRQLLLAVVPMRGISARFLTDVNNQRSMNAMLLDEDARVMGADDPTIVGKKVVDQSVDPRIASAATQFLQQGKPGTKVFDQPFTFGENIYNSAMTSMHPIDVPQKKWWLVLSSSFAEVDEVVQTLFKRALIWGAFVIVSVTAILLSTSVQLIRGRLRLERERHEMITRELTQAREIQLAWLPQHGMELHAMDVAAVNQPASHISGDFYNWFELPDGRTVVTIGDVTGHGIAAAFLMATTQLLVRTTMLRVGDPGQCLDEVNRQLCVQVFNGQFVTMLIVVIDTEQNTIDIANAGHQPPLVSEGGRFEPLAVQPQLVLGVDDGVAFPTQRFTIAPKSSLLLYTDGAVDVVSPAGERFSTQQLLDSIGGHFTNAQGIIDVALAAVNSFRGDRELADDLTFVAIQLQPASVANTEIAAAH